MRLLVVIVLMPLVTACAAENVKPTTTLTTQTSTSIATDTTPSTIPLPTTTTFLAPSTFNPPEQPDGESIGVTDRVTIVITDPDDR